MPFGIVPGCKSAVAQGKSGSFEIAAQTDFDLAVGNTNVSADLPREHDMAPPKDEIASGYHDGLPSIAGVLDKIIAIVSCRADGAPWAVAGHTEPGLKIFRISERMKQSTYVCMNAGLRTNRKPADRQILAESLAGLVVSFGMRKCLETGLRLHVIHRAIEVPWL